MDRKHPGQLPPVRAPRESSGKPDLKSAKPDGKALHQKIQGGAAKEYVQKLEAGIGAFAARGKASRRSLTHCPHWPSRILRRSNGTLLETMLLTRCDIKNHRQSR